MSRLPDEPWWLDLVVDDVTVEESLTRMRAPAPPAYRLKAIVDQQILGRSKIFRLDQARGP